MIRIGLVEDVPSLRKSLMDTLALFHEFELAFIAVNGRDALEKTIKEMPHLDLLLMDIHMPEMDGIAATRLIKNQFQDLRILILTVFDDHDTIFEAILAGANGYLLKDESPEMLYQSIVSAHEGGAPMSAPIAIKALDIIRGNKSNSQQKQQDLQATLSKREMEILQLTAQGKTYAEIAETLFIAAKTVRKHIENIYGKLQVHNKTEAIVKSGILHK